MTDWMKAPDTDMTTPSIDIEVARALGWTNRLVPDPNPHGEMQYTWWKSPAGKDEALPTFSQSADAGLAHIVPWMRERGWSFTSFCWKDDAIWNASFERDGIRKDANNLFLPLAICEAFLGWVKSQKKAQQQTT